MVVVVGWLVEDSFGMERDTGATEEGWDIEGLVE